MQRFVITVEKDETEDVKCDILTVDNTFEAKQLYNLSVGTTIATIVNDGYDYTVTEHKNYDSKGDEYTTCKIIVKE